MRHAEPHGAGELRCTHPCDDLVVEGDQPLRPHHQAFAFAGQAHEIGIAAEQLAVEQSLQPLDLLADRALAQVHHPGGGGHAAGIGHGDEGPQQAHVDIAQGFHISVHNMVVQNNSIF